MTRSCLLLTVLLTACTPIPTFPENGRPSIQTLDAFEHLSKHPDLHRGQAFKLAGRIIRAEREGATTTILALWLPYPILPDEGPEQDPPSTDARFRIRLSNHIDENGLWQGNEFLLVGTMTGLDPFVTVTGRTVLIPSFVAQCLHVWKTAGLDLQEYLREDPTLLTHYPPLSETYCVTKPTS